MRRWSVGKTSVLISNLLKRQFTVTRRNKAWVTDITYIRTWQGWLYLASPWICCARGEITSFGNRLAENFELFVPPSLPWGGHFEKAQYLSILPQVASTLDFARMYYISLTAEDQHVRALIDIGVRATDKSVIVSEHWDIKDGKVIRLLVAYFDPRILLDQMNAPHN